MITELQLGDISVEVIQKDIKNIHLSVNPPTGKVRISAPLHVSLDAVRAFALTKLLWIKEQQKKLSEQTRDIPREFLERESHYVWGKRYLLSIIETNGPARVSLSHDKLILQVPPGTSSSKMCILVDAWYRDLIREIVPEIIDKWAAVLDVTVENLYVQQMKTKWGSCNPDSGSIRLNSDLAKKPIEYLEYVVLHEMVHLLNPSHQGGFTTIMDLHMPNWRHLRAELNRLPVPSGEWA